MAKGTTVFAQFLRLISAELFDSLATRHQANKRARTLPAWSHFAVLVYAQLAGLVSLREIEQALTGLNRSQRASGLVEVRRSTLADANRRISWMLYRDLFHHLFHQLRDRSSTACKHLAARLLSLDSTTIPLCLAKFPWAEFRSRKGAIKLHALLDHHDLSPAAIVLTDGRIHDVRVGRQFQFQAGETVLPDRGYFDTAWFDQLRRDGVNFVTRKKAGVPTEWIERRPVNRKAGILGDWIVEFTGKAGQQYPHPLRQIQYKDPETKKKLTFITNLLDEDAEVIAHLYRQRWQIKLFFKWIKQHLKVKTFLGTDENAVLTQIWIAMIVYLLLRVHQKQAANAPTAHYLLIFIAVRALQCVPLRQAWQGFQRTKPIRKRRSAKRTSKAFS